MKKPIIFFFTIVFIPLFFSCEKLDGTRFYYLSNNNIKITISNAGKIVSIDNRLSSEKYDFLSDQFELETEEGIISNLKDLPVKIKEKSNSLIYLFNYQNLHLELKYNLEPNNNFFKRTLRIVPKTSLRLANIKFGKSQLSFPANEAIHYLTFWMSPTVEFIRFNKGGIFTGIENPFYRADLNENGFLLSFEPGLILKSSEEYLSEAQFIGVYKKSGILVEDSNRPFRFVNGSAHIPIDLNESRAMRSYALDYLSPTQEDFLNINYQFFHPLPQMPKNDDDKLYFMKTIDTFAEIDGDMIIFKPLHPYKKPDLETQYWNVLPEDETSTAREIVDYAKQKGISYGFYMGIAAHGKEGNSAGLSFLPEKKSWKKMDSKGRRATDNCIGNDDFFEWYLKVQDNTIKRYGLSNWSWDPNMGSAMNCHDESHGHIADKGAYKGWRRCVQLKGDLKKLNPDLFIQGFYGDKHFGLWGLKYTDQHEVYSEQTAIVSTLHPQINDDAQNSDGLRFQNYWAMRFRFLPTIIGHSLVHRMSEGNFDRELIKAWDYNGWKYSLMSSLAVSGSVMPAILPYESNMVPGYKEFYKKWLNWAKDTFDYVNYTEPFGEQVEPGSIDGYARIKDGHGFIFLFNGNPRPSTITFEVGLEINLKVNGDYEFIELYPSDMGKTILDDDGNSIFPYGEKTTITIPANSCKLLELRPYKDVKSPLLLGIDGQAILQKDQVVITGVNGKPGHSYLFKVRLPKAKKIKTVKVNGVEQDFSIIDNEIIVNIQFSGDIYNRLLDNWIKSDESIFLFPYHKAEKSLTVNTTFLINKEIPNLLKYAKPNNFKEMSSKISAWQKSDEYSYTYHNFVSSRPDRLWLIIPFSFRCLGQDHFNEAINHEHQKVKNLKIIINSKEVNEFIQNDNKSHTYFMDITDLIEYGVENTVQLSMNDLGINEFMGPYLIYPEEEWTNKILSKPQNTYNPVVYTKSLIPMRSPRYLKGKSGPLITNARVVDNVSEGRNTQIEVSLDLPPDKINSVTYSHSGFPWMGKVSFKYNHEKKLWVADIIPGERWKIQESEYIYVWAVGKNGLYSEFYPVKIGWDFK
ncbi:MAG: hypothetical protein CMG75_10165 [Candidatus Marinimicrobia bacterium]|nr:hypothetical protein [Candidatus Neomarinimicrobiota bacterium]|tara:strand:+ start:18388 stop:21633 length:3246 start_codon:yes stop_codon:yes gene_type:complete